MINIKSILNKSKDLVILIILGLLILCAIFPRFDLTYTHGIDGSLSWVFNHIYSSGFQIGKNVIFPHGPLAFFMYPMQENLLLALFVTTVLQLLLVINIFYVLNGFNPGERWIITTLVSIILLNLLSFNLLILANVILLFLLFNDDSKKIHYKYLAFFLTVFAFYVKAYVAVVSGTIIFSFLVISFIAQRRIYKTLLDCSILLVLLLIFWVAIYGSFTGIIQYFIGMFNLTMSNSAAVSLYPDNYWICLSIFLVITFLISFLQKSPKGYYFGSLLTLSIFAGWKHGMSREDIHHAIEFMVYIIIIFFLFIIYVRKNVKYNIIFIFIAVLLFGVNLRNVVSFQNYKIEIISVNNLMDFISNFSKIKEDANKEIEENINFNKMPDDIISKIGKAKLDIYPWDYSIIPANKLNWQPRPQIQSHSSFTPWLDKKNADHFNSKSAPEFLIWHLYTSSQTGIQKTFESIDGRYLLNDEPQTIIQILRNYELYYKNSDFLVYKKRNIPLPVIQKVSLPEHITWDQWIIVPDSNNDLIRIKVKIKDSFLGYLKDFFYKGNYYYIYYKLSNGFIYKNRVASKIATEGMWIDPYITLPSNNFIEPKVKEILFKCSNSLLSDDDITISWENISFGPDTNVGRNNYPNAFFGKNLQPANNLLKQTTNNFEFMNEEWTNIVPENMVTNGYTGIYSCTLQINSYSAAFVLSLDSFQNKELLIATNCWIKSGTNADVLIVISVENNSKMQVKNASNIKPQIINSKEWNNVSRFQEYKSEKKGDVLKIFLVNIGQQPLLYDDFTVRIEQRNPVNPGTFYKLQSEGTK